MAEHENRFSGMTRAELEKEARKQIVHSGLLALTALIIIAVACYAWFCSSSVVTAEGMLVSLWNDGFELASEGRLPEGADPDDYSAFGDFTLPEEYGNLSMEATLPAQYAPEGIGNKWNWTLKHQSIKWRMDGDSDFATKFGEDAPGLRPGKSGVMRFYVIPRSSGSLTIDFTLDVVPYRLIEQPNIITGGKTRKMTKDGVDTAAAALLKGHLLFAVYQGTKDPETTADMELVDCKTGKCQLTFADAAEDVPIPVTVRWFWPLTWEEASANKEIADMAEENPKYFFAADEQGQYDFGERYNQADKLIGDTIDALTLKLTGKKTPEKKIIETEP